MLAYPGCPGKEAIKWELLTTIAIQKEVNLYPCVKTAANYCHYKVIKVTAIVLEVLKEAN